MYMSNSKNPIIIIPYKYYNKNNKCYLPYIVNQNNSLNLNNFIVKELQKHYYKNNKESKLI